MNEQGNRKGLVPYRPLPKNVCPTSCAVCGDSAIGYHYEVPSCNGCKTFFRRTVIAQRIYECTKEGNCFKILPKEKRCSCRACRFKKCVDVGMNPLAIQMPYAHEENGMVREIVLKRKAHGASELSISKDVKIRPELRLVEHGIDQLIDQLIYLEIKTDKFRKCSYNPSPCSFPRLKDVLASSCQLVLADKVEPMKNWPLPNLSLPPMEELKLSGAKMTLQFPFKERERKHWFLFDILCAVEWAKTFSVLHRLTTDDQILLLKSVTLLCFNMTQAFFSYEQNSDTIIHPDGTVPPKHCSAFEFPLKTSIWKAAIEPLIRNRIDKKEYVLLKSLILCNAAVEGLSQEGQEILSVERDRYSSALFSYCMASKGTAHGPAHYAAVLALIDILQHQAKAQKDFHVIFQMSCPPSLSAKLVDDIME